MKSQDVNVKVNYYAINARLKTFFKQIKQTFAHLLINGRNHWGNKEIRLPDTPFDDDEEDDEEEVCSSFLFPLISIRSDLNIWWESSLTLIWKICLTLASNGPTVSRILVKMFLSIDEMNFPIKEINCLSVELSIPGDGNETGEAWVEDDNMLVPITRITIAIANAIVVCWIINSYTKTLNEWKQMITKRKGWRWVAIEIKYEVFCQ